MRGSLRNFLFVRQLARNKSVYTTYVERLTNATDFIAVARNSDRKASLQIMTEMVTEIVK